MKTTRNRFKFALLATLIVFQFWIHWLLGLAFLIGVALVFAAALHDLKHETRRQVEFWNDEL